MLNQNVFAILLRPGSNYSSSDPDGVLRRIGAVKTLCQQVNLPALRARSARFARYHFAKTPAQPWN
jgi:hypothetical protein